jgi:hypothetical protein
MLLRSASIKSTTFSPRGRSFAVMGFSGALLVDKIDEGGFLLVFELVARLLINDVLGEIDGGPSIEIG